MIRSLDWSWSSTVSCISKMSQTTQKPWPPQAWINLLNISFEFSGRWILSLILLSISVMHLIKFLQYSKIAQLNSHVRTTVWLHYLDFNKTLFPSRLFPSSLMETTHRCCLPFRTSHGAVLSKTAVVQTLTSYRTTHPCKTRKTWSELPEKKGKTQLCADKGCYQEDFPRAMINGNGWRERSKRMCAVGTPWWWW